VIADELRRCGMCQLMKRSGITSEGRDVFICDQCSEDAVKSLETQDALPASDETPDGD